MLRKKIFVVLGLGFLWSSLALGLETADWMYDIYRDKPQTPLVSVAIPGTHNSGTFSMPYWARLEPGQPPIFNLIKPIVRGWSRAQFKSLRHQLIDGIRYLDLRVAFDKDDIAQIVHGLEAIPLKTGLTEISAFVQGHPKEVILIQCKLAFYYANSLDPTRLELKTGQMKTLLANHFGATLKEFSDAVTFSDFWDTGASVMVLGEHQSFWPNTDDVGTVKAVLDSAAQSHDPTRFSNLQLIVTPQTTVGSFLNPKFSIFIPSGESSLSAYSRDLREMIPGLIRGWANQGYHLNILSTDFFNLSSFIQVVLELNQK